LSNRAREAALWEKTPCLKDGKVTDLSEARQ
jgi:hypothetical protein